MVFNRKRKDNRSSSFILDDSPKRTKVQAQRKFAQTSNVNSPVLTPVTEIEIQEKVMPEPIELVPMKRPNTEDFLTFLCFRGTPALPPSLGFFNNAAMTEGPPPISATPGSSKNGVLLPASIGKAQGDKPFIAFGVRKRADPVVVSRHMDKKRRHALALQALRRKYQEQKMAKIRAITISKLSEKVHTNKTVVRTTRSITKAEPVTKKTVAQKTKITVVATKHVKVTTRRTSIQQAPSSNLKQKMTLRNLRNRVVKREIQKISNINTTKKNIKRKTVQNHQEEDEEDETQEEDEEEAEEEEEYSSEASEESQEEVTAKKKEPPVKTNLRVTRSNIVQNKRILLRQKTLNLKGSPTSPRLRSQLRRKILQTKSELKVPLKAKRRILTRKVQIKTNQTKIIAKKIQAPNKGDKGGRIQKKAEIKAEKVRKPQVNLKVPKKDVIVKGKKVIVKNKKTDEKDTIAKKVNDDRTRKKPEVIKKTPESKTKKISEAKVSSEVKDIKTNRSAMEINKKVTPDEKAKKIIEEKGKNVERKINAKKTEEEKTPVKKTTAVKKASPPTVSTPAVEDKKKSPLNNSVDVKSPLVEVLVKNVKNADAPLIALKTPTKTNKTLTNLENSSQSSQDKPGKKEKVVEVKTPKLKVSKIEDAKDPKSVSQVTPIIENKIFIMDKDVIIEEIQPFKPLSPLPMSSGRRSDSPLKKVEASAKKQEGSLKKQEVDVAKSKKCEKLDKSIERVDKCDKLDKFDVASPKAAKKIEKIEKKTEKSEEKGQKSQNIDKVEKAPRVKVIEPEVLVRERPARKTKLAAAIYMEILGRKLVNDDDVDDMSIDSFPELPNVRKMEQRENELKAKMKTTNKKKPADKVEKQDKTEKADKLDKKRKDFDSETDNSSIALPLQTTKTKTDVVDKPTSEKRKSRLNSTTESLAKGCKGNNTKAFSDSDSEKLIMKMKKKPKTDANEVEPKKAVVLKKRVKKLDDTFSFSESDEEPLVKLTQKASENEKSKSEAESTVKQKRECAKRPQNYLPLFSSSDEEEKFFRQSERPPAKKKIVKPPEAPAEVLLSSKDIGKRFGKGKVNMSNEQIEKWLNDSAMAGVMVIKAENDEMLKFGERIPTETSLDNNLSTVNMEHLKNSLLKDEKVKADPVMCISSVHTTPEKSTTSSQKPLSNEKKTIFRKAEHISKNSNAFSACNESSVYAFEADNEDSVSTPFRRPSRRPSSTATSRSEDDPINRLGLGLGLGLGLEMEPKAKFRLPTTMATTSNMTATISITSTPITKSKDTALLMTDDSNASAPQMHLDAADNEPASHSVDNEHMFYLPFQPGTKNAQKCMMGAKFGRQNSAGSLVQAQAPSMFPPSSPNTYKKMEKSKAACCSMSETSDSGDFKYKVPSSPSASSSSSAKLVNKRTKHNNDDFYKPVNSTEFPNLLNAAKVVEAPVFHPTEKEFVDPLEYIEKIREKAERFGVCRIVPPGNFKPECKVLDEMRFTAYNQYVHKMMHRWGPNFSELVAIRKYLATQSISLKPPPWIGGIEVDLPKLYQTVQILGGLKEVIEKKKWPRVSELMKIPKSAQDRVTKLDDMYCKYLLPYDTLSPAEREKLFADVEADWAKREVKMLEKAKNGTQLPEAEEEPEDEEDDEDEDESDSETDIECIVKGRSMALSAFYRIARNTMAMWFKEGEPTAQEVEEEFWKHVTERQHHICVHSGSIDSGNFGYGFAVSKNSPFARHAWNLKVLTNNSGSILRSMGPVMGLTVPTLHVGMLYAGCCWYRDPHSLPWIEYLHTGANKIWYGIPDSMSAKFHEAMLKLVPHCCLNKSLWLPTDTVMVPPSILVDHGVSLTKTLQEPGQFVVVFPKAFTSNICGGYVVSESVFWAPPDWLGGADKVFLELRNSCEPSMFSYERLLLSMAQDPRSDVTVLRRIIPPIERMIEREKKERAKIKELGIKKTERLPLLDAKRKKKMQDTDTEYICEDCRWNLYCSMICDSPDNGFYCLEHAIENLQEKRLEVVNLKLMYTYDDAELETFVAKIHEAIETKLTKKVGGKFAGMATLLNR